MTNNIAISNRRKKLKKVYASKEWKAKVKEYVSGKTCEWCDGKDRLLAHHPYLESYSDGTYTDLYLSGCMVLCIRCHYALHKGLTLCSRCKSHYHIIGATVCKTCFNELHPEIVAAKEKKKADAKALQKMLRDDEKAKAKKWKKDHPSPRPKASAKHQTRLLPEGQSKSP